MSLHRKLLSTRSLERNMIPSFPSGFYLFVIIITKFRLSQGIFRISTDPDDSKFYYYPTYDDAREIVFNDVESLTKAQLKVGASTVLLVDGYRTNNSNSVMNRILMKGFMSHEENINVLTVDYGKLNGASFKFLTAVGVGLAYFSILENGVIDIMGNRVAEFLNFLASNGLLNYSSTHLIGHSLGAHISASASAFITNKYSQKLWRITGLDPAVTLLASERLKTLSRNDAIFVDVYHTNREFSGLTEERTGHINIYINGGDSQPGCKKWDESISPLPALCSHIYSWGFFGATFYKDVFACPCLGYRCSCKRNCNYDDKCPGRILVGIYAPYSRGRGSYHLLISDPSPEQNFLNSKKNFDL